MSETPPARAPRPWLPLSLAAVAGLLVGGGVASGIFLYRIYELEKAHELALEALRTPGELLGAMAGQLPVDLPTGGAAKMDKEDEAIMAAGKAYVDDLKALRFLKVWRAGTEDFHLENAESKEKFFESMKKYQDKIQTIAYEKHTLRKREGEAEFYCTGKADGGYGAVYNIALVLKSKDGEWLIDQLDIAAENVE